MAVKTLDIDTLTDIFNKLAQSKNEMGEQEGESTSSGGGGAGYPAVTKWETGIKRGSANPLGNVKYLAGVVGKEN